MKVILFSFLLISQSFAEKPTLLEKTADVAEEVAEEIAETAEQVADKVTRVDEDQLIVGNEWDNFIAPFTYQSSIALLLGGGLSFFLYSDRYERSRQKKWVKENKKDKPWRDLGDLAGWGALPLTYSAYKFVQYQFEPEDEYKKQVEYVMKTVLYTGLATLALKLSVKQARPKDKGKYDSFPSGHASSAFSFATAVWLLHGWEYGLASTVLASWISYSRIDDGSHYYHDTAAGAALGIAYAIGIYNNHYGRKLPFLFSVAPAGDGLKGEVAWKF